jgi:hypothetical protein
VEISEAEYTKLKDAALRIKEATIPEMTDGEAGRWLKRVARKYDEAWEKVAKKKKMSEAQAMYERMTLAATSWIKTCVETNAGKFTMKLSDTTINGKPAGDWEIRVRKL